tara:strand:- start:19 stop:186 length:168 start_codon:yes stop_codon:yes gene_type:complete
MKTKYILEFSHNDDARSHSFLAENLLDLFEQVSDWKGSGEYAPVYDDEIISISEA